MVSAAPEGIRYTVRTMIAGDTAHGSARAQAGDVNARFLDTSDEPMCHVFALSWERPGRQSTSGANAPFEVAQLVQQDLADK